MKGDGINISLDFNEQLAKELHKPVTINFKKRTVYSRYRDNIWGADLADVQLISKANKEFRFLLCIIHSISIVDASQKILDKSGCKPNKIWVDEGSEFYNNSFKKWLKGNDIEMYSIHKEGKSVVAERLKTKIYKYMTSISKNVYINRLDVIVNEYNNAYNRTIKMKPVDVKDSTYIDFKKEVNYKDPKFKVGDHVTISKYRNIFAKR